jgi:phosphomannomutase/phosphoglucomutase
MDRNSNGIYGVYGQEITESLARSLGQAVGTRVAGGRLIVGGDVRSSTPGLKASLIEGILGTGCDVYDVGVVPVSALHFARDRLWADGVVMVTASHRPPEINGFRVSLGKLPTTPLELVELWQTVHRGGPFSSGSGRFREHEVLGPYVSYLAAQFSPAEPLRVVIDACNGCMSRIVGAILRFLGYDIVERNCTPDGGFGGQTPDPSLPDIKSQLSQAVIDCHADVGVAYDGDGDQVVFAGERGTILAPEHVLSLLSAGLLPYQADRVVVYDASYAPFVAIEIRKAGGCPTPLDATCTDLGRAFLEYGAVLGGDACGHYSFRAMGGGDALYATLTILRIASCSDGQLEPLIARMPEVS